MRLESEDGQGYVGSPLWLVVTEAEARDLAESLIIYFSESPRDGEWHDHVGDSLTLAIEQQGSPLGIRLGLDGVPRRD